MRGVSQTTYFPSSWEVLGIPAGYEDNENKWDLLATNSVSESTYCKNNDGSGCCDGENIGTYLLTQTKKGYKYLRWRLKTVKHGNPYFPTTGIDVFGVLTASSRLFKKAMTINNCNLRILGEFFLQLWMSS